MSDPVALGVDDLGVASVRVSRDERAGELPLELHDLAPVSLELPGRAAHPKTFALA